MSYILEALKKSDAERKRGEVPTLETLATTSLPVEQQSKNRLPWILAATLGIGVVALVGIILLRPFEDSATASPSSTQVDPFAAAKASPTPKPVPEPAAKPEPTAPPPLLTQPSPEPDPVAAVPVTIDTLTAKAEPETIEPKVIRPEPVVIPVSEPPRRVKAASPKPAVQRQHSAKTYVDQAWSAIDKGLFNQALRSLDQSLKIEPAYADAWFARGWANEKSGNELSAIGDYGRAITAKPNHAFALFSRGYLNLYVGSVQSAISDFVRTQSVAKDQSLRLYSHLWLYLSRTRANQDAAQRLALDIGDENFDVWPGPVVRHFLGHMEDGRVIAAMEEGPDASRAERRATGYFFLGIRALSSGDAKHARTYFEKTLATGAIQFRQYDAAKRELDRLNRS